MKFEFNNRDDHYKNIDLEYVIPFGNGSYLFQNIYSIPERRYHSLYNIAKKPPIDRVSLLLKIEESIEIEGRFYNLYSRRISEKKYFPEGFLNIKKIIVNKDEIIIFYKIDEVLIEKKLVYNNNRLHLEYVVKNKEEKMVNLYVRPFFERRSTDSIPENVKDECIITGNRVFIDDHVFRCDENCNFKVKKIECTDFLYKEFLYKMDKNLLNSSSPGYYYVNAKDHQKIDFYFEYIDKNENIENNEEIYKRKRVIKNSTINTLSEFAEMYTVTDGNKYYIMAGYPWFGPWGRDTFISISGLHIYQGNLDLAENIIDSFIEKIDHGIIPNVLTEHEEILYNTVDASLWLINCIYDMYLVSGNKRYINKYYDAVNNIIFHYRKGTYNNIYMDNEDYLLSSGNENTQLTWMDASNKGVVFTPRYGKAVEINALWYNALKIAEEFSEKIGYHSNAVSFYDLSQKLKNSFNREFYSKKEKYLYDCLFPDKKDNSLRPNQLFALSLNYNVIDENEIAWNILDKVREYLYTDNGIRTLSPDHLDYKGKYYGDWFQRDSCYHQGTSWPFLLGAFYEARLKFSKNLNDKDNIKEEILDFVKRNIKKAGIGGISEIFDGDVPQFDNGTPFQAWSVSELIRVWMKYFEV